MPDKGRKRVSRRSKKPTVMDMTLKDIKTTKKERGCLSLMKSKERKSLPREKMKEHKENLSKKLLRKLKQLPKLPTAT